MCFVWISEQTAIISLYSFNLSIFKTEAESVYCAVRNGSLNQTDSFVLKGLTTCYNNEITVYQRPLIPGDVELLLLLLLLVLLLLLLLTNIISSNFCYLLRNINRCVWTEYFLLWIELWTQQTPRVKRCVTKPTLASDYFGTKVISKRHIRKPNKRVWRRLKTMRYFVANKAEVMSSLHHPCAVLSVLYLPRSVICLSGMEQSVWSWAYVWCGMHVPGLRFRSAILICMRRHDARQHGGGGWGCK